MPLAIAEFGYRAVAVAFGVVVLPSGLGCFLVEARGYGHSDYHEAAQSPDPNEETPSAPLGPKGVMLEEGGNSYGGEDRLEAEGCWLGFALGGGSEA